MPPKSHTSHTRVGGVILLRCRIGGADGNERKMEEKTETLKGVAPVSKVQMPVSGVAQPSRQTEGSLAQEAELPSLSHFFGQRKRNSSAFWKEKLNETEIHNENRGESGVSGNIEESPGGNGEFPEGKDEKESENK